MPRLEVTVLPNLKFILLGLRLKGMDTALQYAMACLFSQTLISAPVSTLVPSKDESEYLWEGVEVAEEFPFRIMTGP